MAGSVRFAFSVCTAARTPFAKRLSYPSRGAAWAGDTAHGQVPEAVAAVLGRTRALLLAELAAPASTSELAARTGVPAGGANQHLTARCDAASSPPTAAATSCSICGPLPRESLLEGSA